MDLRSAAGAMQLQTTPRFSTASMLAPCLCLLQPNGQVASFPSSAAVWSSSRTSLSPLPEYSGLNVARKNRQVQVVGSRKHLVKSLSTGYSSVRADGGRQPWDFGRFVQTVFFFNEPPSVGKLVESAMEKIFGPKVEPTKKSDASKTQEVVLVTGATGGVGKRVVEVLRNRGFTVRALVRNLEKAKALLGPDVEVVAADITQKATLLPEYFVGVKKVINAAAVIVGPKEGDTADRQKYYQGIKFFDPEVKGDTPEAVEYFGMQNLLEAVREHLGFAEGKTLFSFNGSGLPVGPAWGSLDDVVMGGVSQSSLQISKGAGETGGPVGLFKGLVSTDNNGGFASVRTKNFVPAQDLSAYEGLELQVKGNGSRFKLIIRTTEEWDAVGYTAFFDTVNGEWQSIRLPFSEFVPIFRARTVKDSPPLDTTSIVSLQLMYSKFEFDGKLNPTFQPGPFELPLASIKSYLKEPITPRFVHVSSAGVTRPDRPGLDLSKQPPAVRMNKELGYVMTFKLKGEDLIRESGIPYTIVRPCALTEEPAGAELLFEQGDNITGKISREEVARICVSALATPTACCKTFEVKSTVPFSQPFTVDPSNPPPERDYGEFFGALQSGVTGKEALASVSTPV